MMNLFLVIIGSAMNGIVGLFVFLRERKSATHQLFFLLSIDIVLWSVANYFAFQTKDILVALYWTRAVMALAVGQGILFFFLMMTLPHANRTIPSWIVWSISTLGVITAWLCMTSYVFPSIIYVRGAPSPTPGSGMAVFVFVAVGSVAAGILTLVKRLRNESGVHKQQLLIVGFGVVSMLLLILVFNFVFVVVFAVSSYVLAGPIFTLPFVFATGYAIVRHRFLDVRPVIARAVSYTLLMFFFGIVYALAFSLMTTVLTDFPMDSRTIAISTLTALCMLASFPWMKRMIERATDAVFYKDKYDVQHVLYRLSNVLARTMKFEDVTRSFLSHVNAELRLERSSLVIIDADHVFTAVTEGYNDTPEIPEPSVVAVAKMGSAVFSSDVQTSDASRVLAAFDASCVFPMYTSDRCIGLFCVGGKRSGEPLSPDDRDVLSIITPEVAVAIQNALSYEEIRRFTVTLEDEVSRATADLVAANTKLQELDTLKDEFVSLASHELRTPLTAIRSYIWMALSGKGGAITEKQRYYLDRSFRSTDRLIKLVNDMLNISRIESGRMAILLTRVNVLALITGIVEDLAPRLSESGIRCDVSSDAVVSDVVSDADKLSEVLLNILGNAIKFTPKGGRIRIVVANEKDMVRISVTDTGIGIDPVNVPKLFTKFGALRSSATPDAIASQSTGLGLYISKAIVARHGGTIRAISPGIGKGTTVSFTIPMYSEKTRERLQKDLPTEGLGIIHTTIEKESQ